MQSEDINHKKMTSLWRQREKKEIIIVNGSYNEKSFSPERIDRKYALDLNFHKSAKVKTDFKESTFM